MTIIILQVRATGDSGGADICRDMVKVASLSGVSYQFELLDRQVIAKPNADADLLWQNLQHAVRTKRIGEVST